MDGLLLKVFQLQVQLQCHAILGAAERSENSLARRSEPDFRARMKAIDDGWAAVQDMLAAAANISKALWGSGGKHSKARPELRESVGVTDDSPLRRAGMRNHFEHFDERIETWWKENANHAYIDRHFTDDVGSAAKIDIFRNLHTATWEVIFWGDRYDLRDIIQEAHGLSELLTMHSIFGLPDDFDG